MPERTERGELTFYSAGLKANVVVKVEQPGDSAEEIREACERAFGVFAEMGRAVQAALAPMVDAFRQFAKTMDPLIQPWLRKDRARRMWRRKKDPTRGARKLLVTNDQLRRGRCVSHD